MNRVIISTSIGADWWYSFKESFPAGAFAENQERLGGNLVKQAFAPEFGDGYVAVSTLDYGFGVSLWKFCLYENFQFVSPANPTDDLLVFAVFKNEKSVVVQTKGEANVSTFEEKNGVYIYETTSEAIITVHAYNWVTCCLFVISRDWFFENLPNGKLIFDLLVKRVQTGGLMSLATQYDSLLTHIVEGVDGSPTGMLQVKANSFLVVDVLVKSLLTESEDRFEVSGLIKSEMLRLVQIEKRIIADLTTPPPILTALAYEFGMSVSKLKILFKRVYGKGLYEYFQMHRMHKAHQLIESHEMRITQAGRYIGYKSLSNFSVAFKKEFGYLPSKVVNKKNP